MPLPATSPRVDLTHARIATALEIAKTRRLPPLIAECGAATAGRVREEFVPYLTGLAAYLPPAAGFPQAWIDGMVAYAAMVNPLAQVDWLTAYNETGDAIRAALTAAEAAQDGLADGAGIEGAALQAALEAVLASID